MTDLQSFVNALIGLANNIIPLMLAVVVIVFIWGVIHFLAHPDSPDEHKNMRSFLLWGVIAITIIISIWGLATALKNTLFPSAPCPVGVSGCGSATQNSSAGLPTDTGFGTGYYGTGSSGSSNTGSSNTGSSGSSNTGSPTDTGFGTGYYGTGSSGSSNTGSSNTGNSGSSNLPSNVGL